MRGGNGAEEDAPTQTSDDRQEVWDYIEEVEAELNELRNALLTYEHAPVEYGGRQPNPKIDKLVKENAKLREENSRLRERVKDLEDGHA